MGSVTITSSRLIGVEGKDEVNFISEFLKHLNIEGVQVLDFKGKSNFNILIPALINTPGFDRVTTFAIIRDADQNADDAFRSVSNALGKAGLSPPAIIDKFAGDTSPSVGIYIMPGNGQPGMLEDLCLESVAKGQEYHCIDAFFDCVDSKKIKNMAKAKVQTYLAIQPALANSLGVGATKGYWDFNHPCFTNLADFLNNFS